MFLVKWGPDNQWGTAYGQRERAEQHADDLRPDWPEVIVVELDLS